LIEQILSYKTLFFSPVITISNAFLPAMNQSLHNMLVEVCTSRGDPLFHSCYDGIIARKMYHTICFSLTQADRDQKAPNLCYIYGWSVQLRLAKASKFQARGMKYNHNLEKDVCRIRFGEGSFLLILYWYFQIPRFTGGKWWVVNKHSGNIKF